MSGFFLAFPPQGRDGFGSRTRTKAARRSVHAISGPVAKKKRLDKCSSTPRGRACLKRKLSRGLNLKAMKVLSRASALIERPAQLGQGFRSLRSFQDALSTPEGSGEPWPPRTRLFPGWFQLRVKLRQTRSTTREYEPTAQGEMEVPAPAARSETATASIGPAKKYR